MKPTKQIRAWLSAIGARGGKAGKGSELRRKLNRKAALARWQKEKANHE